MDETHAIDECGLAARVSTLQEAVTMSLATEPLSEVLFVFARAIKAFEVTTGRTLPKPELPNAFSLWWSMAKEKLPADADYDEYKLVFFNAFERVRSPLGANSLDEAIRRSRDFPPCEESKRFTNSKIVFLINVCFHLQNISGDAPFFLAARSAQKILQAKSLPRAAEILNGLVVEGLLHVVTKGTPGGRKATRYRFIPDSQSPLGKQPSTDPSPKNHH
jgi:hypothetical protein